MNLSQNYRNVAIVIPTRNEIETVGDLISSLVVILPGVQICVVDDNSPDGTARYVSKKFPKAMVIVRENEKGRGSAVLTGMQRMMKFRVINKFVVMDADGSHDPHELPDTLYRVQEKKVILASRYVAGSTIIDWPFMRRLSSRLANIYISAMLHLGLHDNTNGYRVYSRSAVQIVCAHAFISSGYIMLSESAVVLKKNGYMLCEIPSRFVNRKRGKSNATINEFISSFRKVWEIRKNA